MMFGVIGSYLALITLAVMFIHIGDSIQNKITRKKYFIYLVVIVVQYIIAVLISQRMEVPWLDILTANIIFITFLIMVCDMAKSYKDLSVSMSLTVWFIVFIGVLLLILGNVFYLARDYVLPF